MRLAWGVCSAGALLVVGSLFAPAARSGDAPASGAGPVAPAPAPTKRVRTKPTGYDPRVAWLMPFGTRGLELHKDPALTLARAGLVSLVTAQQPDGRWVAGPEAGASPAFDVGITGLVLCAFLGAGVGPGDDSPAAKAVDKGLRLLLAQQDKDGFIGRNEAEKWLYNHALASTALVEAAGWTGDERLYEVAHRALKAIAAARSPYFAFGYAFHPPSLPGKGEPQPLNTAITLFLVTPLLAERVVNDAATRSGLVPPFPDDFEESDVHDGVKAWFDRMTDPEWGRVGYQDRGGGVARPSNLAASFPPDQSESLSAGVGWYWTTRSGDLQERIKKSVWLVQQHDPATAAASGVDYVFWLYGARLLGATGRGKEWLDGLQRVLTGFAQRGPEGAASWPVADPWSQIGGPSYATAMAVLCLCAPTQFSRVAQSSSIASLASDPLATVSDRARALRALGTREDCVRSEDASAAALAALRGAAEPVRRAAAVSLPELEPHARDAKAVEALVESQDPVVAAAAVQAVFRREHPPLELVAATLQRADATVRRAAAEGLARLPATEPLPPKLVDALRSALRDTDPLTTALLASALARVPSEAATLIAAVGPLASSTDQRVRQQAAVAIGRLGKAGEKGIPAVEPLLRDSVGSIRLAATTALVRVRGLGEVEAASYRDLIASEDPLLREGAAWALRIAGVLSERTATLLAPALEDPDEIVALTALDSVREMGPDGRDAAAVVDSARWSDRKTLADAAEATLAVVMATPSDTPPGTAVPATVDALRAALSERGARLKLQRAALRVSNVDGAMLLTLASDPDATVRRRAVEILHDGGKAARGQAAGLAAVAADADVGVRAAALRALARIAPELPSSKAAAQAAITDPDLRLRSAGLSVLLAGPVSAPSTQAGVRAGLADGDPACVVRAAEVLSRWQDAPDAVWVQFFGAIRGASSARLRLKLWTFGQEQAPASPKVLDGVLQALLEAIPRHEEEELRLVKRQITVLITKRPDLRPQVQTAAAKTSMPEYRAVLLQDILK